MVRFCDTIKALERFVEEVKMCKHSKEIYLGVLLACIAIIVVNIVAIVVTLLGE